MKLDFRFVCVALAMSGFSATAFAQDEPAADPAAVEPVAADPTAGDMGGGDMGGGEATTDDAAPVDDAGGGGAEKPISVKLLVGYGLDLEDGSGNPWGLGFGLGGGYNLDKIYLGARFIYYLGESNDTTIAGMTFESSFNVWELGIEAGYDVDLGGAVLRPGLGLGVANMSVEAGGVSASDSNLYVAPGVLAQFDVSDSIFLGAEARFQMVFADPDMVKALILMASGGMKF
jgi:hypothetical protein